MFLEKSLFRIFVVPTILPICISLIERIIYIIRNSKAIGKNLFAFFMTVSYLQGGLISLRIVSMSIFNGIIDVDLFILETIIVLLSYIIARKINMIKVLISLNQKPIPEFIYNLADDSDRDIIKIELNRALTFFILCQTLGTLIIFSQINRLSK